MTDKQRQGLEVLAELAGRPAAELRPELYLVGDLGIDSPKALQLLIALEEKLGIEIADDDAARMDKVGDLLDFLARA